MKEEPVLRGILDSPRLGRFRVPLDIYPFIAVLLAGFMIHLSLVTICVLNVLLAMCVWRLRKQGEGTLRGFFSYAISRRIFLPSGKTNPSLPKGFRRSLNS